MDNLILVSRDIQMRPLTMEDAPAIFELVETNRQFLRTHLPWVDKSQSVDDTLTFIASTNNENIYSGRYAQVIEYKNKVVGLIDFHKGSAQNKSLEIGYWLAKDHNGKGIMTRACAAMIDYAFHNCDVNRIIIRCATKNFKSQSIPQRLGFMKEGVERQAHCINGTFVDVNRNCMLREDWVNQQIARKYLSVVAA